jgi:hypothetical protein
MGVKQRCNPENNKVTSFEVTLKSKKCVYKTSGLKLVYSNHLTALVVAAAWAGDMGRGCTSALRTNVEFTGAPALSGATEALFHLGGATFWYCHSWRNWCGART